MLKELKQLVKNLTGQEDSDPEHIIDLDYLRKHEVTSRWVESAYGISPSTLKNYRRGFYFRDAKRFYYKRLNGGTVLNLQHIPQVEGEPVRYKVSWVNEWLRLIGQQDLIPNELQSL